MRSAPEQGAIGNVLVTGGAGFIGCALSRLVGDRAERWVVVDNLHPQVHPTSDRPAALPDAAELVVADVVEASTWDGVLVDFRPDVVVHLAAETGTAQSFARAPATAPSTSSAPPSSSTRSPAPATCPGHLVLPAARAPCTAKASWRTDGTLCSPARAPTRSSKRAVGLPRAPPTYPTPWSAPTRNRSSVYGATKLAQEHVLGAWGGSHACALSVLRLQNVYGPGQSLTNPYTGIVSLFSQLARQGKSIPLYEDGEITRDFVFIDDVATALAAAIAAPPTGPVRTLDIGVGVRTTIRHLATTVAAYHGAPEPHVTGQFRDGDVRHAACDVTSTVAQLAWSPQWSLTDGVGALQDWIEGRLG